MTFNIVLFAQCIISSIIELLALSVLAMSSKREFPKNIPLVAIKLAIFALLSAIISYTDNDTFIFRLLSIIILYVYLKILSRSNIIHSIYLTIIAYICALIIQFAIIVVLQYTAINQDDFYVQMFGNGLTLLGSILVARFVPIHYIYDYIIRKDYAFRFFLGNTFVIIFFINYLITSHLSHFIYYIITIAIVVALLIFVNVELLRSRVIVDKQKNIIDNYNKYLPIVDELIEQVRSRQHSYHNNLQSLNALAMTCDDYETLRSELMKNIDVMSHSDLPMHLLKFNLKLLSGLLFQKYSIAAKQGIHMDFTIKNYNIQSAVPEYTIVEAVGILMDNAIEASSENDTVYITIDCVQNKFHFYIMNIGPTFTSDFYKNIFTRGYTTKSSTGRNHGLGLNHLLEISKKYDGRLGVGNENHKGDQYLFFSLDL